jgi:DNA uptake protein ComE-like DNA-binding protein
MESDDGTQLSTERQERTQSCAFATAVCLAACSSVGFAIAGVFGSAPPNELELAGSINPNDAPVASLMRLPNVGAVRAEAIVAYREDFRSTKPEDRAFRRASDLQKVKGIGPKIAKDLCQWLKFE